MRSYDTSVYRNNTFNMKKRIVVFKNLKIFLQKMEFLTICHIQTDRIDQSHDTCIFGWVRMPVFLQIDKLISVYHLMFK